MSCTHNNNMNSATTSSSSTTTVDDISNDIGRRIDISKDVDDISRIDISGGQEEKICNNDKGTSCDQKLEHKKVDYDASNDDVDSEMVSGDIGKDIDAKDICANCGKEGANNTCNKCKQVKYCNAACKKRHRHKHKKDCEEYLRCAAELRDIELFKRPPLIFDDCPICFQRLPNLDSGKRFQACCGKEICCGCIYAVVRKGETDASLCPFCRTPAPESNKEVNEQLMKRVDVDDAEAIHNLGFYYSQGLYGLPQDWAKAFELRLHAAELGHVEAHYNIGCMYANGRGVARDMKKATQYFELGAMKGDADARYNLGTFEYAAGNKERAMRHYMIAVGSGDNSSLKNIQKLYAYGHVTKDEYTTALRAYQQYLVEIRSPQRDQAAARSADFKYICDK